MTFSRKPPLESGYHIMKKLKPNSESLEGPATATAKGSVKSQLHRPGMWKNKT
jgi:hypothetical protein